MARKSLLYLLISIVLTMVVGSCAENPRSQLDDLESAIEENPDSVLSVLSAYQLPQNAPESQKALYNYLLTYARYKCFIDETDDSRISMAVEYYRKFTDHYHTAMSLFLKGTIQRNTRLLGPAVISLTEGVEIAEHDNLFLIQGFCHKGIAKVYNSFFDIKKEFLHSKEAYKAFRKSGRADWINIGILDLLISYSNGEQYNTVLKIAPKLYYQALKQNDINVASYSLALAALAERNTGNYPQAIKNYIAALKLSGDLPEDYDWDLLLSCIDNVNQDCISDSDRALIDSLCPLSGNEIPFEVLYNQGRYKEAYEALELHRKKQDAAIKSVGLQDVSTSLYTYNRAKEAQILKQQENERIIYTLLLIILILIFLLCSFWLRQRIKREELRRKELIALTEDLTSDLTKREQSNIELTNSIKELFNQKFDTLDSLCMKYYETHGTLNERKKIAAEIERHITRIGSDASTIQSIENYVNKYADDLMIKFRNCINNLKEEDYRFFLYTVVGFSARSISLFLDEKVENIYNRKSRLKTKIINSECTDKKLFLEYFLKGNHK